MCVILYANIGGKQILAKNRDRTYKTDIQIIHEIVNGIELVYFKDLDTNWMEGMNEHGCAMVNSSLYNPGRVSVRRQIKKNPDYLKHHMVKGNVFHNILCEKESVQNLLRRDRFFKIVEGHTLLVSEGKCYQIEESNDQFAIKTHNIKKNIVLSNHGIDTDSGYQTGKKGVSSFLRKKIVEEELKKVKKYDEVLGVMNRNYSNIDPRFHPYRDKYLTQKYNPQLNKSSKFVRTTAQILLNITDKEFIYFSDALNEKEVQIINRLPKFYEPKIKVIIQETSKSRIPSKIFSKSYLKKVYKKYNYNTENNKTLKKIKNNNTSARKHINKFNTTRRKKY